MSEAPSTTTTPATTIGPEPTFEEWVYAGTRVSSGKPVHAWLQHPDAEYKGNESELWYVAKRGDRSHHVGAVYQVRVERGAGKTSLYTDKQWLRPHPDAELRAQLEARHRAAETRLRHMAMEKSGKRSSALDEALEPLLTIAAKTPTFDRDALMLYVMRRIARA